LQFALYEIGVPFGTARDAWKRRWRKKKRRAEKRFPPRLPTADKLSTSAQTPRAVLR
jgi:hypothetical protein